MNKAVFIFIFCILFFSFASAENRIFSGKLSDLDVYLTPLSFSYQGIESYAQGDSGYSVDFFQGSDFLGEYGVSYDNIKSFGNWSSFYFIADVPSLTDKLCFFKDGDEIKCFYLNEDIVVNDFNVVFGSELSFTWDVSSDEDYFVELYYSNDGVNFDPILYETPNSYLDNHIDLSSDYIDSGNEFFKIVASTLGMSNEKTTNIFVPNQEPLVEIISPLNNSVFSEGNIFVEGLAEDSNLVDIKWYLDGNLLDYDSSSFELENVSQGKHKIIFNATDSEGLSDSDESNFFIDENSSPEIILEDNISFYQTENLSELYYAGFSAFVTFEDYFCNYNFSENGTLISNWSFSGNANSNHNFGFWFYTNMTKNHSGKINLSCQGLNGDLFSIEENISFFGEYNLSWCNGTDFNHDGVVDSSDYVVLKENFGASDAIQERGDANSDGVVDSFDLKLLGDNMGRINCDVSFPEIVSSESPEFQQRYINNQNQGSSGSVTLVEKQNNMNEITQNSSQSYNSVINSNAIVSNRNNEKNTKKQEKAENVLNLIVKGVLKMIGLFNKVIYYFNS